MGTAGDKGTKDRIVDALEGLLEDRSIDDVKTKEIIERSGISKQTFYYYYRDKYDVAESSYLRMYDKTLGRISRYYPYSAACSDLYDLYEKKREVLKNSCSSSDPNGLRKVMQRTLYETYKNYLQGQGLEFDRRLSFILDVFIIGGCETTARWIESGMNDPTKEELVSWYQDCMPEAFKPYFK